MKRLGFRVLGLAIRVQGSGSGFRFWVRGSGFGVKVFEFRISGSGNRV
jgi:hypothetical protein